ncbi:hypothetical protein E8E11_010374 [Didymella keratinophila]|nr:hypothetical protein E8E11_010374 [Didymella keratinophila]
MRPPLPASSRHARSEPPATPLSFLQYKDQFDIGDSSSEARAYDPSTEEFPDDDWYTFRHDEINNGIHAMCDLLLGAVRNHSATDTEVKNLNTALETADIVLRGQQFFAAFLGEQGIGKSSIINAIFSRDLVNVSASSSAYTAYPTIITYRAGARDDSKESDVRVEYLSDAEVRECAHEQARRYRDAFPRMPRSEPDTPLTAAEDLSFEVGLEDELSEDEDDEDPAPPVSNVDAPRRRIVRPSVLRGAKTAKSFFNIIFATNVSEDRAAALQHSLDHDDIEDIGFADANNVGVLDLPGYGDDNHIRTAIIDRFREMANFEIVQLFSGIRKHIKKLREAPFDVIRHHLAELDAASNQGVEDKNILDAYRDYLLKEARGAYIEQAAGLPRLRRYLFHLPSQTNYRTLHYHVFETLPDIATRVQRILEKFDGDEGYTQMREYLAEQLPIIRSSIEILAKSLPSERVLKPFVEGSSKPRITTGLKGVVQALARPIVYYPTFAKMLKENGIPTNGAGLGLNLNQEILNAMVELINDWNNKMQGQTLDIAVRLDEPIQGVLSNLRKHINEYEGNPELRNRATEALDTTTRRIGMAYGKMAASLQSKLREVHLLFTTEVNVHCPIALEMRDIYRHVLLQQLSQPGKGSYARQRARLLECLYTPDWPKLPFPDIMEQKIVNAQVGSWKDCCAQYVIEAMNLLQDFARTIDELLDNGTLLNSEHRRVRTELENLLPGFQEQLRLVQSQFPGTESRMPGPAPRPNFAPRPSSVPKSIGGANKRKAADGRAATQPPTSEPRGEKRMKTALQLS